MQNQQLAIVNQKNIQRGWAQVDSWCKFVHRERYQGTQLQGDESSIACHIQPADKPIL